MYKRQLSSSVTTANTYYPVELHALRLGNTAIVSNPLELYIDWGIKIKTESPADLTIIGQLSSNTSSQHHGLGYGPTKKALDGAGYGGNNNILSLEDINLLVDVYKRQVVYKTLIMMIT